MSTKRPLTSTLLQRYRADVQPAGADDEWLEKWAPICPEGHPQRLGEILGFRLKRANYLQLRVVQPLGPWDCCCARLVDEHPDRIYVRVVLCSGPDAHSSTRELDAPCNVWLDAPLGERVVIDIDTGEELPLLIPGWGTDEPSVYVPRPPGLLWPPDDAV